MENHPDKISKKHKAYTAAVGRRKEAVARVRLTEGPGLVTVNGKPINEFFTGVVFQKLVQKPFEATASAGKYTISVLVAGGGLTSQLDAVIHGISRVLAAHDREKYRDSLKKAGFLTRDARVKERRKYGLAQKARAKKQSPKR